MEIKAVSETTNLLRHAQPSRRIEVTSLQLRLHSLPYVQSVQILLLVWLLGVALKNIGYLLRSS